MTKPVNLFMLSRITAPKAFNRVEKHDSGRPEEARTQEHEITSLRTLVDALMLRGVSIDSLDGFFFGFHIPQIGKEFDLLKFSPSEALNIELKSREVPQEQILAQLRKNRHYLSHLGRKALFYTVVTDSETCWRLENGELVPADMDEIARAVKSFGGEYLADIDNMFRAADYLVSPVKTPERFIKGEYFLTHAQEQVKKRLMDDIAESGMSGFFSITGRPGTGKTLLIYDIAKELAQSGNTLMIHCGRLLPGQLALDEFIKGLSVISAERLDFGASLLNEYDFILADEAHRFSPAQFDAVCENAAERGKVCIFSSDPEQVLSTEERNNAIADRISALPLRGSYELYERIRMNREIAAFISAVRNLNRKPEGFKPFESISLVSADSPEEARQIITYYKEKGYVFINYSRTERGFSPYWKYEEDFDTHHVIGQEFDRVLMLMDSSFYYDESGRLQGIPYPDMDYIYPNLFYQGVTRVREKLAIAVVEAPELFEAITSIFT